MKLLNKKVLTLAVIALSSVILLQSGVPNKIESSSENKKIIIKGSEETKSKAEEVSVIEYNEKTSQISNDSTLNLDHLKSSNIEAYFRTLKAKSIEDSESEQQDLSKEEKKELAKNKIKKALVIHLSK